MVIIDDKREIANKYVNSLTNQEKQSIINFMLKYCKSSLNGVYNIPRLVFLNGYYYGKILNSGKLTISEYLESPFAEMLKSVQFNKEVNAKISDLDVFMNNPTDEQKAASDCFSKGFNYFRSKN